MFRYILTNFTNKISKASLTFTSRNYSSDLKKKTLIGLLGVPFNKGQLKSGVALGPQAIRDYGLVRDIIELNSKI